MMENMWKRVALLEATWNCVFIMYLAQQLWLTSETADDVENPKYVNFIAYPFCVENYVYMFYVITSMYTMDTNYWADSQ